MDNYNIGLDYGPANWDIPHRFVASYLYDIPFLKNSPNMVLRSLLGGWQVSGITTWQSGAPVNPGISRGGCGQHGYGRPAAESGRRGAGAQLPAEHGRRDSGRTASPHQLLRRQCVRESGAFTFGNAGRNILRGPKSLATDLSLMKNFVLHGDVRFQFRVEMYNVFNNVNYSAPNATLGNANFGVITGADALRRIQLGGKLIF